MAVNEKDIEEFEDMFDLSSDKNDEENDQTEEYGHSTESIEPFESLAKEVSEKIQESDHKGSSVTGVKVFDHALTDKEVAEVCKEDPHDIIKSVCSDGDVDIIVQEKVEEIEEKVEEATDNPDDDFFDELPVQEKPAKKEEAPEDPVDDSEDEIGSTPVEGSHSKTPPPKVDYGEIGSGDDKIEWMLESPSAMYNSFYQRKRDLLFKYMVGGQIEYKRWTQELEEAKVTIKGEVFDHQLIIDQMEAVQQHRERVKAIHVRVNNQYFTFKRFVEMMRGFMARTEYLKPVIRQEGLIMEHMRDVELYYARLEALHDSATKTEKMLAAAFDTLSRKCTICMELKPSERVELKSEGSAYTPPAYTPPKAPPAREKSSEFDKFDDLPSNAQAAPIGHKVGAIGWGDI